MKSFASKFVSARNEWHLPNCGTCIWKV